MVSCPSLSISPGSVGGGQTVGGKRGGDGGEGGEGGSGAEQTGGPMTEIALFGGMHSRSGLILRSLHTVRGDRKVRCDRNEFEEEEEEEEYALIRCALGSATISLVPDSPQGPSTDARQKKKECVPLVDALAVRNLFRHKHSKTYSFFSAASCSNRSKDSCDRAFCRESLPCRNRKQRVHVYGARLNDRSRAFGKKKKKKELHIQLRQVDQRVKDAGR